MFSASASRLLLTTVKRRPRPTFRVIAIVAIVVALFLMVVPPLSKSQADDTAATPTAAETNVSPQADAARIDEAQSATPPVTATTDGAQPAGDHADPAHPAAPSEGAADHEEHGHSSPIAPVLAAIVLLLFFAKLSGDIFERLGMPAVLGELFIGVLLGNMGYLLGFAGMEFHALDFLRAPEAGHGSAYDPGAILAMLAEIGVVLLLFEVGLESNIGDMLKVGASSFLVAILGVIAPMILGMGVGWYFLPDHPFQTWLFLGATLCATSVGITARVLKDLGRSQQRESKIILGAAVIDDVLGLVVLAIVTGIITQASTGEKLEISALAIIIGKAFGFLALAIVLGGYIARPIFKVASYLMGHGLLVATSLVICFGLAYLATLVQLAPIVGAFAAGLILDQTQYQELGKRENLTLEHAMQSLTALLVPIFFVQMGINVRLEQFLTSPNVWMLAAALTLVAILGKQVCALGVLEKGQNRLAVGLGMIPRGEVGLIFANEGKKLFMPGESGGLEPVISEPTYAAVIVMVMITTMVTPPLLKWAMNRGDAKPGDAAA